MPGLKKCLVMIALLIAAACWTGMGGGAGPRRIPDPERNFSVTLVDRDDVRVHLVQFSIEGMTFFFGQKGKGTVAVSFERIQRIDFSQKPDRLAALVTLKKGEAVELNVDRHQNCYGISDIGNYQISLKDVKSLTIDRQVLKTTPSKSK